MSPKTDVIAELRAKIQEQAAENSLIMLNLTQCGEQLTDSQHKVKVLVGALEYFFSDWRTYEPLNWKYKAAKALATVKGE